MHTKVAVLGGGPGGYAAAFLAADLGLEVTLIEAQSQLGGECLLRGCIPSKALLHVARFLSERREMSDWGVHLGEPNIDLDAMRAQKQKVVQTLSKGLKQLAKNRKVRVIQARGVFEDSHCLRLSDANESNLDDDRLTFDECIIATGSSPAMPEMFNLSTRRVMDSSGALDLTDIPATLLVVGGGYIGLEMGTVYAELGSKVTIVEMTGSLLPGVDSDLVKPLAKRCEKLFENILLETKVVSISDEVQQIEVEFAGQGETNQQTFDSVLVAIGRRENTSGFGLENTRVIISPEGFIQTDQHQRTADEHIFAVGDVVGQPMLAHKATHQGKVAAETIAGKSAAFDPKAIPAVVFTDPEIAWAGLTEQDAKSQDRSINVAQFPWAASGRAQAIGRTDGLTKIIIDPDSGRVLGVGIVGVGAGELIAEAVLAIEMGCSVSDISRVIHTHPTMSETLGHAADVHFGLATDVYRPKRSPKS